MTPDQISAKLAEIIEAKKAVKANGALDVSERTNRLNNLRVEEAALKKILKEKCPTEGSCSVQ